MQTAHKTLHILFASETGKGEQLAAKARETGLSFGFQVQTIPMNAFGVNELKSLKNLLIIVSTHGNGAPAFPARTLYTFLSNHQERTYSQLRYAVLGLGDSAYPDFCKAGLDFDRHLNRLGATRVQAMHAGDVDVATTAPAWLYKTMARFQSDSPVEILPGFLMLKKTSPKKTASILLKSAPTRQKKTIKSVASVIPSKSNPYRANILLKKQLNSSKDDRKILHLELDINDSGLNFLPGDALGVMPQNTPELIQETLKAGRFDENCLIKFNGQERLLTAVLNDSVELSKLTPDVVKRYKTLHTSESFTRLMNDSNALQAYLKGRDVVDLLNDYPTVGLLPQAFLSVLRPLQPRLYSIASSPLEFPDKLHLTIGVVSYEKAGRNRKGTCSTYLSDVKMDDEHVSVFIEPNPHFRLPADPTIPIILIGTGTGVAPYRAFLQHRSHSETPGKSWLFFGNRFAESDFLYQSDWIQFIKKGVLTRMDVAFSRDSNEKKYVQHRMLEHAAELYQWMQEGAIIYLCGGLNMAKDVQQTLVHILSQQKKCSTDQAEVLLDNLQTSGQLRQDVY